MAQEGVAAVVTLVYPIGSPYEWINVPFGTVLSSLYVLSVLTTLSGTRALSRTREATQIDLTGAAALAETKAGSATKLCPRMERLRSSVVLSDAYDERDEAEGGDEGAV